MVMPLPTAVLPQCNQQTSHLKLWRSQTCLEILILQTSEEVQLHKFQDPKNRLSQPHKRKKG